MDDILGDGNERRAAAEEMGTKLYGKNWRPIIEGMKDVDPVFGSYVEEVAYGTIYPRAVLGVQYREVTAIAILTQLNLKPQLKSHIIAARNNGISRQELVELFLHFSMFIGFPLALDGLRIAKEVFDREDAKKRQLQ